MINIPEFTSMMLVENPNGFQKVNIMPVSSRLMMMNLLVLLEQYSIKVAENMNLQ
jgi:hypothetical protein